MGLSALAAVLLLAGCGQTSGSGNEPEYEIEVQTEETDAETEIETETEEEAADTSSSDETDNEEGIGVMTMNVQVGDVSFTAALEENDAVSALIEMMEEGPVTLEMDDYSGFEKVGPLGTSLPASNSQTTTQAGDIVLYQGNQIVMFYGSNSWSYTRIGHITDLTGWEEALGSGSVTVTFSLEEKKMDIQDFLPAFSGEEPVRAGTDVMRYSDWLSNEAMKLTTKLNNSYHTPEEIREILSELTGKEVDETVSLFPPFYTDCGKNISFGRRGGDERCTGKYGCGWNAG